MRKNDVWKTAAGGMFVGAFLCSAHAQTATCKDPWITQAYRELYNRMPVGTAVTGDCDITHYGNGHWSSYQDLKNKVAAHNAAYARPVAPSSATQYAPLMRPNSTRQPVATVAPSSAFVANGSGGRIISQDSGGLISDAGANAKPSSSIISQDSGGMRSLQSVDKPHAPAGKYLVIPGGNLVDSYGNTVRFAGAYSIVVKNGVSMIGTNGKTPVPGTLVTP